MGQDFLLGNEAIARGAIEANVDYVTGYPGTPSTEILETLAAEARKYGLTVEWSTNEMVAFENALGVSLAGLRAIVTMKHAGFNWIADPLSIAVLSGIRGGLVIVTADDPNCHSSANEQDNRFYGLFFGIPTLEPASPQEAKDMTREAFSISEKAELPVILRTVTRVSHSRGIVRLDPIVPRHRQPKFERELDRFFITSVRAMARHHWLIRQQSLLQQLAEGLSFNKLRQKPHQKKSIVTSGVAYGYVEDALHKLGTDDVALLKVATPYPLPRSLITEAVTGKDVCLVVEEGEPFIELQLKALVHDLGLPTRVVGKMSGLLPGAGELNVQLVTEAICSMLGKEFFRSPVHLEVIQKAQAILPSRTMGFCAGCPHTASVYALKKVISRQAVIPFVGGDIGCYTMMSMPPHNLGDAKYSIGASLGVASGLSGALGQKTVAVLGDSTFIHAGIPSLINAVYNKKNVMLLVLDNQTTAMTGGQPHAGTGVTATNEQTTAVDLEQLVRACGVQSVEVTDSYDLEGTERAINRAFEQQGVSVVISRRLCALEAVREAVRSGKATVPYQVNHNTCIAGEAPYCQAACPIHNSPKEYIALVRKGDFTAAAQLIRETLPFPEIVGRVCTHPCETTCKRAEVDEPVAICALKRAALDYAGKGSDSDLSVAVEKDKKIAVVGGGPAGLIAAVDLRRLGYQVTIFEAMAHLGGLLAAGIPEFRLPAEVVARELSIIDRLGIESRLNTRVGTDLPLSDLRREFDAVFLAIGTHKSKRLPLASGTEGKLINGIDFLREVRLGHKNRAEGHAIVVGGGNVAVDCARTCLRLGYEKVTVLYRRSREDMPAIPDEVRMAEAEGVEFVFHAIPRDLLTQSGRVKALACLKTSPGTADATGKREPVLINGSDFEIEADLVIAAVGEEADLSIIEEQGYSVLGHEGLLRADPLTLATPVHGVFAGGDAVSGPGSVIDALADGRKAAVTIDRFLTGQDLRLGREKEGAYQTRLTVSTWGARRSQRRQQVVQPLEQRKAGFSEVEQGLTQVAARAEAERCLGCECYDCLKYLACPAMTRDGEKVGIDRALCTGCAVCAQVCPTQAIALVQS